MNFLKSWSFWFFLVAGFVLSWLVFGPVSAFITLGIIAIVGGLTFLAWWVCGVIIARLADPESKGGTRFFIKAREGCFAVIMRGGKVEKLFMWVKGKHLSPNGDGTVLTGEGPKSFLYRLYGYEWIGWYPQFKPLRWLFEWEKIEGTEIVAHAPETIQFHYHTYLYGMRISGVEDSELIEMDYGLGVQLETVNILKTLFGTSSDPGDWNRKVRVGIFSRLRDFSSQPGRTFETITKMMTSGGTGPGTTPTDFVDSIMAANNPYYADGKMHDGLIESVGQKIKEVNLLSLSAPEEYVRQREEIKKAEQQAQAQAKANEAIRSKANAEADAEKARLTALAQGFEAVARAGGGAGAAMYAAEKLSQLKGTLVLGQGAGIAITPKNSESP